MSFDGSTQLHLPVTGAAPLVVSWREGSERLYTLISNKFYNIFQKWAINSRNGILILIETNNFEKCSECSSVVFITDLAIGGDTYLK